MTKAQFWWKTLRVYTENIEVSFDLEFIVRIENLFHARVVITHE